MIGFILLSLLRMTAAYNSLYIHNCLQIANPYTSTSTTDTLIREVDTCLARTYLTFPIIFRDDMRQQIQQCIDNIKETARSKPEYHALEKSISQMTSNIGSSVVDSQHSVSQLAVCAEPLKILTSIDIYEETRLGEIVDSFVHNIQHVDVCIQNTMQIIDSQVTDIEQQLADYTQTYEAWLHITKKRRQDAENCKLDMDTLVKKITKHIVHGLHS